MRDDVVNALMIDPEKECDSRKEKELAEGSKAIEFNKPGSVAEIIHVTRHILFPTYHSASRLVNTNLRTILTCVALANIYHVPAMCKMLCLVVWKM